MHEGPSEEDKARMKRFMDEMAKARIQLFASNAPDYAKALGAFRTSLREAGFSAEESMQIVLKVAEQPGGRGFRGGRGRHWHKGGEAPKE